MAGRKKKENRPLETDAIETMVFLLQKAGALSR
jgi:hypothetical protein